MSTTRPRRPWRSLADYGGSSRAAESSDKAVTRASLLVADHWRPPDARYSPGRTIRLRNVGEDTANLGPQARTWNERRHRIVRGPSPRNRARVPWAWAHSVPPTWRSLEF